MLRSNDFPSVASRIVLACLGLQLFGSACSKQAPDHHKPSAAVSDASVAADGGETSPDAGGAQAVDAAADAAREDVDAGRPDAAQPHENPAAKDAGKSEAAEPFDLKSFSTNLAQAVCASLRDCLGEQKLRAFLDNEDCEVRFAKSFAQSDFGALHDSVENGRMQLHPEGLQRCYADTRKLGCAIQTERLPASCQSALKGMVKDGESCTIGADCAGESFCPASECPRVCTARRAAAGSCERDEECLSGLICVQGQCAKPASIDQACAGTSMGVCELGKSCVGSNKDQAGKCVANSDVQVGELGAVCTPGGALCREGLSCAYDGDQGFSCQEAAQSGANCHLALPTQCPASEYCTAEDVTSEGKCAALPKDGENCVLGSECAGGHVCLREAEGGAVVCKRVRDLAEACEVDAMCRSGRCAQGKCAAIAACD